MRLSETEWRVMNVLWKQYPAFVRTIHQQLRNETGWAYNTVRTILNRLVDKGAVKSEMVRNSARYSPVLLRDEARRSALHWLTERAFNGGTGSLMQFLVSEEKLSPTDRQELKRLLQEIEDEDQGNDRRSE